MPTAPRRAAGLRGRGRAEQHPRPAQTDTKVGCPKNSNNSSGGSAKARLASSTFPSAYSGLVIVGDVQTEGRRRSNIEEPGRTRTRVLDTSGPGREEEVCEQDSLKKSEEFLKCPQLTPVPRTHARALCAASIRSQLPRIGPPRFSVSDLTRHANALTSQLSLTSDVSPVYRNVSAVV